MGLANLRERGFEGGGVLFFDYYSGTSMQVILANGEIEMWKRA